MADKLFPGQDAVGKSFYSWGDNPIRIVGVVDHLVRPSDQGGPAAHEYSMLFPLNAPYSLGGNYLLRTQPGRRPEVLKAAVAALARNGPNSILLHDNPKTKQKLSEENYIKHRAQARHAGAVVGTLTEV